MAYGLRAALRRSLVFAVTLILALALMQLLLEAAPGDPSDLLPPELRDAGRAQWGLDQPPLTRFAEFLERMATGDWGASLTVQPGAPVRELAANAIQQSTWTVVPALALALLAAIALASVEPHRRRWSHGLVIALSAAPVFLLAHVSIVGLDEGVFALWSRGIIDRPSWFALPDQPSTFRTFLAIVVLATGSGCLARLQTACEGELDELRASTFVRAARARGAPLWPHLLGHLIPRVAGLGANELAFVVGGLVVIERIFELRGAGALFWDACLKRDYPVALGLAFASCIVVGLARLLADALRIGMDPRAWTAT